MFEDAKCNCKNCSEPITLQEYQRKSSLCDECEAERLLPPDWEDNFDKAFANHVRSQ